MRELFTLDGGLVALSLLAVAAGAAGALGAGGLGTDARLLGACLVVLGLSGLVLVAASAPRDPPGGW